MLSDEKLLQVLPFLYKVIQKEFGDVESDDLDMEDDLYIPKFSRIAKNMGIESSANSFFYFMNAIIDNSENLKNGTLTLDNIKNPKEKEFVINISEVRYETTKYYGEVKVSGYFTESQLEKNVDALNSENEIELHDYNQIDSEYINGDGEGIEVDSEEEVYSVNETNSLYKFLDSLTESEKKFLKNELSRRLL
jgi:hypothetical protein